MAYLDIHFLNVGHGDCTIIDFPGRLTVVDINNCKAFDREVEAELRNRYTSRPALRNAFFEAPLRTRLTPPPQNPLLQSALPGLGSRPLLSPPPSPINPLLRNARGALSGGATEADKKLEEAKGRLTNPIDYLKENFKGKSIFRYIQTHPDMDHMAGLHRLWVEENFAIQNFWDTSHCISKDEAAMQTGPAKYDVRDWRAYLRLRASASNPTVLRLTNGARADFYQQDGIHVWAPFDHSKRNDADADPNDLSYVLCISFGACNILLGGDASLETWDRLYECNGRKLPKIHLLKAPHHGRKSGYHPKAVKAMNPDYTVLSVGELKKKDDASATYEAISNVDCFSTVDHGNIRARCWSNGVVDLYDHSFRQIA